MYCHRFSNGNPTKASSFTESIFVSGNIFFFNNNANDYYLLVTIRILCFANAQVIRAHERTICIGLQRCERAREKKTFVHVPPKKMNIQNKTKMRLIYHTLEFL